MVCIIPHTKNPLPNFTPYYLQLSKSVLTQIQQHLCSLHQYWSKNFLPLQTPGIFHGLDFHLLPDQSLALIEINTNAGGALLATESYLHHQLSLNGVSKKTWFDYFVAECQLPPQRLAIIDHQPTTQFLYPEFKLFAQWGEEFGLNIDIISPQDDLSPYQLIYNRLTDFYLESESNKNVKLGFEGGAFMLTPNPYHYQYYAAKENLIALSQHFPFIPKTVACTPHHLEHRKGLFFKPIHSFGSHGVYRGDKLSHLTAQKINCPDYIVQDYKKPSEFTWQNNTFKFDLRAYFYRDIILMVVARVYQGQATNMRTPGGGFCLVQFV